MPLEIRCLLKFLFHIRSGLSGEEEIRACAACLCTHVGWLCFLRSVCTDGWEGSDISFPRWINTEFFHNKHWAVLQLSPQPPLLRGPFRESSAFFSEFKAPLLCSEQRIWCKTRPPCLTLAQAQPRQHRVLWLCLCLGITNRSRTKLGQQSIVPTAITPSRACWLCFISFHVLCPCPAQLPALPSTPGAFPGHIPFHGVPPLLWEEKHGFSGRSCPC